jgi:hypothetical protein
MPLNVLVFSTPWQQTTISFLIPVTKGSAIRLYLSRRMASLRLTWNLSSLAGTPMIEVATREIAATIRLIFRNDLKCGSKPKSGKYSDMRAYTALYTVLPTSWNWYLDHIYYHCCCKQSFDGQVWTVSSINVTRKQLRKRSTQTAQQNDRPIDNPDEQQAVRSPTQIRKSLWKPFIVGIIIHTVTMNYIRLCCSYSNCVRNTVSKCYKTDHIMAWYWKKVVLAYSYVGWSAVNALNPVPPAMETDAHLDRDVRYKFNDKHIPEIGRECG